MFGFDITRAEFFCLLGGIVLLFLIVEMIRKRRLKEEYALLWIAAAICVMVLSLKRSLLHQSAAFLGIFYPPVLLAIVAGFFGLVIAIHYSLVISRLSGENRVLAQDVALLKLELAELKRQRPPGT